MLKQGMKISKEYEKKGGGYENEPGSENKPQKGTQEALLVLSFLQCS